MLHLTRFFVLPNRKMLSRLKQTFSLAQVYTITDSTYLTTQISATKLWRGSMLAVDVTIWQQNLLMLLV